MPAALDAIGELRRRGLPFVLATGRRAAELLRRPALLSRFDAVIGEGGGILGPPHRLEPARADRGEFDRLSAWLRERRVPLRRGEACLSVERRYAGAVRAYPGAPRLTISPNRDRADVTLRDVNKGTALALLGRRLELPMARVLAFGDGENDLALFARARWGVAVKNAAPALKRAADDVTSLPGGHGVAAYLRARVAWDARAPQRRGVRPKS